MKLYIIAAAAFLISLLGSTVAVVVFTDPAPPAEETLAHDATADSLAHGEPEDTTSHLAEADTSAHADSSDVLAQETGEHSAADTVAQVQDTSSTVAQAPSSRTLNARQGRFVRRGAGVEQTRTDRAEAAETRLPTPTLALVPEAPDAVPAESIEARRQEAAQQIARILAAMKPADAAAVLRHMSDQEVVDILRYFNTRKAAGVMAGFTDTRAAAISRRLLLSCEGCGESN